MKRHHAFIVVSISFLLGIALASWWRFSIAHVTIIGVGIVCGSVAKRDPRILSLLGMVFAMLWFSWCDNHYRGVAYMWNERGSTEITGIIESFPEYYVDHQVIYLRVKTLDSHEDSTRQSRIRISLPAYPRYQPGDELRLAAKLKPVPNFVDFSYENYLYAKHVHSLVTFPRGVEKIGQQYTWQRTLFVIRNALEVHINRILPEPSASLLAGILFGIRRNIPDRITEIFQITGTSHILAVSGYNISILIATVMALLRGRASPMRVFLFSLIGIFFFVFLCGAGASVMRAALMGLSIFALRRFRRVRPGTILLAVATTMVVINPMLLLFDSGFQLSFAATAGILFFADAITKYCTWVPTFYGLRETMVATLSSHITLLPFLVLSFHRISLIAIIANLLVLPLVPLSMAVGALAVVASFFLPHVGFVFGLVPDIFLQLMMRILNLLSKIPYASVNFSWRHAALFIPYYLILFFLSQWIQRSHRKNRLRLLHSAS